MDRIYSPWRSGYIAGEKTPTCVFCDIFEDENNDIANHVIYRDEYCFAVMNRYPYTPGHFMIIPKNHIDDLNDLNIEIWLHINRLSKVGYKTLLDFGARGVNIGMNIKVDAGAGIPEHLHLHLVPRWIGDTNFISSIGNSRVYGVDFEDVFQKIKILFNENLRNNG